MKRPHRYIKTFKQSQQSHSNSKHTRKSKYQCKHDFYTCVNGQWLRSVKIPPYLSAFGISEEVEKRVESQLFQISHSSSDPTVKALSESAVKRSESVETIKKILQKINCIRDTKDVAATLGQLCLYKIGNFFSLECRYYYGNDGKFTLYIDRGSIGLPNRKYYRQREPFHHYKEFLEKVGRFFDLDHLSDIVSVEHDVAPFILSAVPDEKELYVKGSSLQTRYSAIPWSSFFEMYGFEGWKEKKLVVSSDEWLSVLNKAFKRLSIDTWKQILSSEVILHFIPYLPSPLDTYYFEFYRKELRGQMSKLPLRYAALEILTTWATPFVSKEYVHRFLKPSLKTAALSFAEEIRAAACKRMETVEWLQPATRAKAAEKIAAMRLSIAYPDAFGSLKAPKLSSDNLVENLMTMGTWRSQYELGRLDEVRNKQKDWDDPVYAVNGYYYSEANELVIPSGSLLEPFFSETKPLGWNYGAVGAIIGHEMTHAFDEEGCEYDEDGQKKKWWTAADTRNYKKITQHLVKLFHKHTLMHHHIDGRLTLSENIADLGGLAIALDALNVRLQGETMEAKKAAYKQFFIAYAVSWRIKERPKKQLQGLFMDKHAPTPLRVNLVVNQFQEWYDAFDIFGGAMFLPVERRVRIF
jgi:predicted metalloendopeptidase